MNFFSYFVITTQINSQHVFQKAITVGVFSFLMLFSFVQPSDAVLWDLLIIDLNAENKVIVSGDTVVISGTIVDHAYKPIPDAEILIRTGTETTIAFTDSSGVFRGEFKDFQKNPGTYTVNVVASLDEMMGLSSTQFLVKGVFSPLSILQEKLDTDDAKKYLNSEESDFEKNPIGKILFKYYHGLLDELVLEREAAETLLADQIHSEEQRKTADKQRTKAIEEFDPKSGVFDGYQYESYINSLNPEIKDLVISQLEFTKSNFEKAQNVRDEIIANGGTYEEARQAYLDIISIPKEKLEEFNQVTSDESSETSDDEQIDDSSEE